MLQFLCQVREVLSCQQGALGAGPSKGRWVSGTELTGGWVWLGTDISQGNDDLALHNTNKTIQTMLMKCLGSSTLVNSNLFCFFSPHHCAEFCSLLILPLRSTVSQCFSALLSLSAETEMERGRRRFPSLL